MSFKKAVLLAFGIILGLDCLFAQTPQTAKEVMGVVSDTIPALVAPKIAKPEVLKFNLNESGTHYFQATFLNQVWLRYDQSNPNTLVQSVKVPETFDIGLRRTRIQMFGQITDRTFVYFQFGQNNFNAIYNSNGGNRKQAVFFHDALGEYRISKKNELKIGAGLTITNGLSRFSQPAIGSIMTTDVPVFAQATVDQTDEFSRKLSVYVRGQIGKFDYRASISDPFPITSNGQTAPILGKNATFTTIGHTKQFQTYLMYQFFDHEQHNTPYMIGTHLGQKKVFNIAGGIIHQKNAMWKKETPTSDSTFQDMTLWCIESYLDMPLNKEKGNAISAYAGYFNYNFGTNYLRFNGIMNPANGITGTNNITGAGATFGNAYPMMGTGNVFYTQFGYLLPKKLLGEKNGQLLPYVSVMSATWNRLGVPMRVYNVGINWLISGHKSKLSLDYQNRPTYSVNSSNIIEQGDRRGTITLQYQIFI
jgi:hypothetical protein